MYAVINRETGAVLRTCRTREAAMIAAQQEKDRHPADRSSITAVAMDDGGFTDIYF